MTVKLDMAPMAEVKRLLDDKLVQVVRMLQQEFPVTLLVDARVEFRTGERHDHGRSETWSDYSWSVQVDNDRASGDTLEDALVTLRRDMLRRALVPGVAERIATLLQELPDEGFARTEALMSVQNILDRKRREGR